MIDDGTSALVRMPLPGPVGVTPALWAWHGSAPDRGEGDGLQILLTPLQLAAVLEGGDFEPPRAGTAADRWWGAASVLGGALELVGAVALFAVPEPTLVTKGAGTVLGAHGLDTAGAGLRQVWTGQPQETLTAAGVRATAEALSVDPETARKIGMGADIGVPLIAGGIGALRALTVRRGVISLAAEEAAGGHTILQHVAKTESELLARFTSEPWLKASTSFTSLRHAERAVSDVLTRHQHLIRQWAADASKTVSSKLPLELNLGRDVGHGFVRGSSTAQRASGVKVVLRRVVAAGRTHFVLTAYPLL